MARPAAETRAARTSDLAHLEMPPTRIPLPGECIGNLLKLIRCHFWKIVEVHNGPAPSASAADDVAARWLVVSLPVDTVAEVNRGVGARAEGLQDRAGGSCLGIGQARHQVQCGLVEPLRTRRQQLREDLERVGTVSSAAHLQRRCPKLRVLVGEVRHAVHRRIV